MPLLLACPVACCAWNSLFHWRSFYQISCCSSSTRSCRFKVSKMGHCLIHQIVFILNVNVWPHEALFFFKRAIFHNATKMSFGQKILWNRLIKFAQNVCILLNFFHRENLQIFQSWKWCVHFESFVILLFDDFELFEVLITYRYVIIQMLLKPPRQSF